MSELIDTTEMYLRTLVELDEEGTAPMRARIAERLQQSSPTVSQTVARMERDGLLTLTPERTIELTPAGRAAATRVMRRHRLAECLLTQVIGLPLELVHDEACRWEHVISGDVERRLVEILGHPRHTPYGTPIPGLDELGEQADAPRFLEGVVRLGEVVSDEAREVVVRRLSENVQRDAELLADVLAAGMVPGATVRVRTVHGGVELVTSTGRTAVPAEVAADVYVDA